MKELPPVKRLAHAIALQAVNDYRTALGGADVEGRNCDSVVREYERFFRSPWFLFLTDLDGEDLIEKLRAEIL